MKHLGDICKIDGHTVPVVDVIVGGSPCQDLSVAGKGLGLQGERSGLFMEQIRIIKEMREEDAKRTDVDVRSIRPRYLIWENVPGAESANFGEDYRIVLEEVCKVADKNATVPRPADGKWGNAGCIMGNTYSVAWKIVDAQYFGTPQRRRRICLVADYNGFTAPQILFDPQLWGETEIYPKDETVRDSRGCGCGRSEVLPVGESVSRNTQPSGQEGQGTPGAASDGTGESSKSFSIQGGGASSQNAHGLGINEDVSFSLNKVDIHAVMKDGD